MKNLKELLSIVRVLLAGVLIGYILMIIVYSIPTSWLSDNYNKSIIAFENGYYPNTFGSLMTRLSIRKGIDIQSLVLNNWGFTLDKVADYIMLNKAAYNSDYPTYMDALYNTGYSRYWHGYLVFLKPLLIFVDYQTILILML
jgi:hypothetical protein